MQAISLFLDRKNKAYAFVLFTMMVINSAAEALSIGMIIPVLGVLADPGGIGKSPYLEMAYNLLGSKDPNAFVITMALSLVAIFVIKNLYIGFLQFVIQSFIWANVARVGKFFIINYLRLPYTFHLKTSNARMLKNVTYGIPNIFVCIVQPALQIAGEILVIISIVAVLAMAAPISALFAVVGLGGAMAVIYSVLRRKISAWGSTTNRTAECLIADVGEMLTGIKEIKVLGAEAYFRDRFDKVVNENGWARKHFNTVIQIPRLIIEAMLVGALLFALAMSVSGGTSLAEMLPILGLYGMAAMRLLPGVTRIATNMNNMDFNSAPMRELVADLKLFQAADHASRCVKNDDVTFQNELRLDAVTLSYPGRDGLTLNDINLSISRGEWTALVGPSGAGKSTIANILMGLLHPTVGNVLVDGKLVDTESHTWRSRIGFISQDCFILHDTVRRNIAFGEADGDVDENRVHSCVQAAQLENVVAKLPNGLDTVIGTSGVVMSGGEGQRLAIARALYHGAEILIMDEPTSALDPETEKAVMEAVSRLVGEKTIITIAHRLSTIRRCDRVFLIEAGQVVATGTFDQLASGNEKFMQMIKNSSLDDTENNQAANTGYLR